MSNVVILYSTFPGLEEAKKITRKLVEEKLVACVNIFPVGCSIYQWQGKVVDEREVYVFLKTTQAFVLKARERLISLHPYSVPCILDLMNSTVNQPYLDWMRSQLGFEDA